MLAAQYSENTEDISLVRLNSIDKPTSSAPGELVVRVHAAAVNPVDIMVMKGIMHKMLGWSMPLPFTIGYDIAGVVDSINEADQNGKFKVGDRVFGVNWGSHKHHDESTPIAGAFAEYALIPASKLSKLPENVTFEQGAAVALVGTTAHQILFQCAQLTAGSKVLILGGPSAVGQVAIQLAKSRGAWVATTSSARNLAYVSQFGADLVVNYNEQKWDEMEELKGLDAVIDTVGEKEAFFRATAKGVVKADGAFVSISSGDAGFNPAGHPPLKFSSLYTLSNNAAVQDELASMLATGALKITIDSVFPFTEEGVHGLLNRVSSGASNGKNVLKIV